MNNQDEAEKWSVDKIWNITVERVTGDRLFFNVLELKCIQLRNETGQYSVTLVIGTFPVGFLFGEKREEAEKIMEFLVDTRRQYLQACRDHDALHQKIRDMQAEQLDVQKKIVEHLTTHVAKE